MVEGIVTGFSSGRPGVRGVMPHPFDGGVELLRGRAALLAKLCAAPILFGFFTSYLDLNFTLPDQQQFLLFALTVAISAWVLMTTLILSVEWLRGNEPDFEIAAIRALRAMPKVVLSYFALFAIVFFGAVILRPLVLFAILFIWAPFFCAGEVFAPSRRDEEEDDAAAEMEIEDGERLYIPRPRWFVSLPPWDLGFARSMMFSVQNFAFTIQFGLLLWVTSVVPLALAVLVSGYHLQFFGLAVRVVMAAVGLQYVLFSGAVAFLQLLPKEGADELGLVRSDPRAPRSAKLRRKTALSFILLSALGLASSYVVFNWMDRQFDIPESVVVRSEAIKVENGQLVVRIRLDDPEYRYHWLEPKLFRLKITPEGRPEPLPAPLPETEVDAAQAKLLPAPVRTNLWEPDRVMAYDDKGGVIPEDETSPRKGAVSIAAHLGMPESFGEKGRVELYYHVRDDLVGAKPLAAGEYRTVR